MKKVFPYILIVVLILPLFGTVSAASTAGASASAQVSSVTSTAPTDPKALLAALKDIYARLSGLSDQTQLTITQLGATGTNVTQATLDIVSANAALARAQTAITKLNPASDSFKYSVTTTEGFLKDARNGIVTTLSDLKASLPSIK
ncbi:MAG TPA: hypothetical protein VL576_01415 [Candidatus Paceibacterota bacterium]|jgi:hypothetical protein|nr:hypothetical protein [Candidatus Paceibacterota bacterium]